MGLNFLDSNDFNIEKHIMREFYNNNPIDLKNLNKTRQIIKQTFAKKLPKNAPLPQTVYKDKEYGFWGDVLEGQFTLIGLLSVVYEPYELFVIVFVR